MRKIVSLLAVLSLAVSAFTQTVIAAEYDEEFEDGEVFLSLTKTAEPLKDVTTNLTVITEEEIKEKSAKTLGDIIEGELGISYKNNGPLGQTQSVFMRGASSAQTLVLIDGRRVNDVALGTADFTAYDVYVIDTDAKIIHTIRYGNGEDRHISYKHTTLSLDCYQGSISWDTGEPTENAARVYTVDIPILHQEFHVTGIGTSLYFTGRFYDANGDYVTGITETQSTGQIYFKNADEHDGTWGTASDVTIRSGSTLYPSIKKMKMIIKKPDGSDFTPSEIANTEITVDGIAYKLTSGEEPEPTLDCFQGTLNGTTGEPQENANRVYTAEIPITTQSNEFHITGFGSGYWFGGRFYDANGDYVAPLTDSVYTSTVYFKNAGEHNGSWGTASDVTVHIGSDLMSRITKMKLVVRTQSGSDAITPSDVANMEITVEGNSYKLIAGIQN